ncbi:MAG: TRAP transporter substrate-binding protein [Burkholderiaceae bacterium]
MMMKPLQRLLLAAGLGLGLATGVQAAEVKIALDGPASLEKSGSYNWTVAFGKVMAENGFEVKELPNGSIGGEAEKLDQVQAGLLEVSLSDVKSVGKLDAFIYGVRLPYIFNGVEHMDRALAKGKVFDRVNKSIADSHVRFVAIVPLGPPSGLITTKKGIHKPADMADMRMRALDDAQIAMYNAWGSAGTIVSWKEVPAAMQTGVVDGYMNSATVPLAFGQTDIVRHFTDAKVINSIRAVIVSADWYDGLSDAQRAVFAKAVEAGNKANRAWVEQIGPKAMAQLKEAGVEVIQLEPAAREAFRKLSLKVYDKAPLPREQVDEWLALSEATAK